MRGIRSFMGWSHILDIDTTVSTADDNPFAGSKLQPAGKVSVHMSTDDWLRKKINKLNVTLAESYPSCSSGAGGLLKDQVIRPARSQSKWYGLHTDLEKASSSVSSWSSDASKLNSSYSQIAKAACISSNPLASRQISQETLRRWRKICT